MNEKLERAKEKALQARYLYNTGAITFGEAEEMMREYRDLYNKKAEAIALKYGMKPKRFSVKNFLKFGR